MSETVTSATLNDWDAVAPADDASAPADDASAPADDASAPADDASAPADDAATSTDELTPAEGDQARDDEEESNEGFRLPEIEFTTGDEAEIEQWEAEREEEYMSIE